MVVTRRRVKGLRSTAVESRAGIVVTNASYHAGWTADSEVAADSEEAESDRTVTAKDSDRYNFATFRDAPAHACGTIAQEGGNVISVSVLTEDPPCAPP